MIFLEYIFSIWKNYYIIVILVLNWIFVKNEIRLIWKGDIKLTPGEKSYMKIVLGSGLKNYHHWSLCLKSFSFSVVILVKGQKKWTHLRGHFLPTVIIIMVEYLSGLEESGWSERSISVVSDLLLVRILGNDYRRKKPNVDWHSDGRYPFLRPSIAAVWTRPLFFAPR